MDLRGLTRKGLFTEIGNFYVQQIPKTMLELLQEVIALEAAKLLIRGQVP